MIASNHPEHGQSQEHGAAAGCCPRPTTALPALMEELVEEILLRIAPDEPAHLFRAALVCKPWRRIILSDPGGFLRRYRAFHRRRLPPLLGFFCNDWAQPGYPPCLNPTTTAAAFPSLAVYDRNGYRGRSWCILDCRHGRVLLRDRLRRKLIVWDPISDAWQELQRQKVHDDDIHRAGSYCFAVLCTVAGCDHHDCRGGPFLVVYLSAHQAIYGGETIFRALVYSSKARAWGAPVLYQFDGGSDVDIIYGRAAVVGDDEIYCLFTPGANVVKYDLVKRCISFFTSQLASVCSEAEASHDSPPIVGGVLVLTQDEDGLLGLASIRGSRLYLWSSSRMAEHDGELVVEWVQQRAIELDKILANDMKKHSAQAFVSGFAEGVEVLFICTHVGTFTFELKSGRVRKITASKDFTAFPFISFFTPCVIEGNSLVAPVDKVAAA